MTKTLEEYKKGELLLIDKPLKWSSFQVVNKIRWHLRKTFNIKKIKVGHAGTLDPLATGLLIICTGKMTKQIEKFQTQTKGYSGTITLGSSTPSYDLETAIDQQFATHHITKPLILKTVKEFEGEIMQYPPLYSALKKDGKRLYEFARAGKEVSISARQINVYSFKITDIKNLEVDFQIKCSKGTYIRSLAHYYGKALRSGAHLSQLRRTSIGTYGLEDALTPNQIIKKLEVL